MIQNLVQQRVTGFAGIVFLLVILSFASGCVSSPESKTARRDDSSIIQKPDTTPQIHGEFSATYGSSL